LTAVGRNVLALACFMAVAVAFTWPLVLHPTGVQLGRQFDYQTLLWVVAQGQAFRGSLHTLAAAWPLGQDLHRVDSVVLFAVARLLGPGVSPEAIGAGFVFFGPVLSAWAAERFAARALGATFPWSLLAGLAYGFSGIAATAALEGHAYALLDPWLPLCGLATLRALEPDAGARHGAAAGLAWCLALLNTAYCGVNAGLLVAGLTAGHALRARALPRRPLAALAAVVLAGGAAYAGFFTAGSVQRAETAFHGSPALGVLEAGSTTLPTALSWSKIVDLSGHSIAPTLGATSLALAVLAPAVLGRRRRWRTLLLLALAALLLSLGPTLVLGLGEQHLPWLLRPLADLDLPARFFRFPARLTRITTLALGAVAAAVATEWAAVLPRRTAALLACAAVDAVVGTGLSFRASGATLAIPSALAAIQDHGAVLDLFPTFAGGSRDKSIYAQNLACSQQRAHGRPLVNPCIGTTIATGPDAVVAGWLFERLLDDITWLDQDRLGPEVRAQLAALDLDWIVLRPLLVAQPDRERLASRLTALLGAPVAESRDAGEWVVVHAVPGAEGPASDPVAAYRALADATRP